MVWPHRTRVDMRVSGSTNSILVARANVNTPSRTPRAALSRPFGFPFYSCTWNFLTDVGTLRKRKSVPGTLGAQQAALDSETVPGDPRPSHSCLTGSGPRDPRQPGPYVEALANKQPARSEFRGTPAPECVGKIKRQNKTRRDDLGDAPDVLNPDSCWVTTSLDDVGEQRSCHSRIRRRHLPAQRAFCKRKMHLIQNDAALCYSVSMLCEASMHGFRKTKMAIR
ncbi:hypothetical protein QBC47DRAFT_167364 [Echria macrotheca]|uniref:Uncharacterized protein n=1 Tax=Echria macrotheca TaxID=438768 RepID=A0AAJ0BGN3_9PEZI|nr:hypothetical protein QBC47DRAFT_167364 [Echria macrotheca]